MVQSVLYVHRSDIDKSVISDILKYSGADMEPELLSGILGHVHLISGDASFSPDGQSGMLIDDLRIVLQLAKLLAVLPSELNRIIGIDGIHFAFILELFSVFVLFHG